MAGAWSGAPYMVEHPVTCLVSIPHIGEPNFKFDPNDYGDPYTKETWLWTGNGFRMPPVIKPGDMFDKPTWVEPTEGSKMHLMAPSENRANLRAATPPGFARAVFEANASEGLRQAAMHTRAQRAVAWLDQEQEERIAKRRGAAKSAGRAA